MFSRDQLKRAASLTEEDFVQLGKCRRASAGCGKYYAHSVIKSEIFQVTRRSSEDRYLHLIAFVTHQYFPASG